MVRDCCFHFLCTLPTGLGTAEWDQFAVNEKLFGVKTDFDENKYTTELDKNSAFYKERIASADRIARLIEHVCGVQLDIGVLDDSFRRPRTTRTYKKSAGRRWR